MYYELKITVLLKQSKHHLEILENIGNWISLAQLTDSHFKQSHYEKGFKHFVFSRLYPLEKDGFYQRGRAYVLTIRSSVEETLSRIKTCMQNCLEDEYFQLIACEQHTRQIPHITEMTTITPVIVTIDRKPWVHENNIEQLLQQLHANAEKKYKHLYPEKQIQPFQPFIQGIRIENRKPIALSYKGRKLLGNKLRLLINEDECSQSLAN
ncbi:MAG: CRISPR-associated protein Cas6, partial [Bacilli bacterium]